MTAAPHALIAESLISGAVSGVTTVQDTPSSLQHQANPWMFVKIEMKTNISQANAWMFLKMTKSKSLTCAKLPAEAVHTPAVLSWVLSGMQAIAFDAGRTLKAPEHLC